MSNETKHSPGPWRFGVVKIPETRSMTDVYGFILIGGYKTFEECEKNLPMLNAAPELLATLKQLYDAVTGLKENVKIIDDDQLFMVLRNWQDWINANIRKAEKG